MVATARAANEDVATQNLFADRKTTELLRTTNTSELVIALCGPIGSPLHDVATTISSSLTDRYGYEDCRIIRLSDFIREHSAKVGGETGRLFLPYCQRVAEEIEEADAAVGELQKSVCGLLRVAVPVTFGRSVLAPALPDFMNAFPQLTMELELTNRTVDPVEEGFDLIVRPGPLPDSSLTARELGNSPYAVVASAGYLARHPPITSPADLATHLVIDQFLGAREHNWGFERGGQLLNVPVRPRLDLNDAIMRRDAAIAGLGVALVPLLLCSDAVTEGKLQYVFDDWKPVRFARLYALWPSRRNRSPRLRAFLDFLLATMPSAS